MSEAAKNIRKKHRKKYRKRIREKEYKMNKKTIKKHISIGQHTGEPPGSALSLPPSGILPIILS